MTGRAQKIFSEISCLLIAASAALFFLFWNLDILKDLNHNVASIWYFNFLGHEAHINNVPITSLIEELCKKWTEVPGHFNKELANWYVFAIPLSHVWISTVRNFIAPITENIVLSSSIIGFAAVIMTYITGRVLYSRQAGIFAALYLGTSLMFILTVRNGYIFYSFDSLLGTLAILVFFMAHKTGNRKYLYLSGAAFSIGWFNGYSMFLIFIPVIFLAFIFHGRISKSHFTFTSKNYLASFAIAFGIYFICSMIYSAYLNIDPADTFIKTHHFFFWRSGSSSKPLFHLSNLMENIKRGLLILFYKSYLPPSNIASPDNVAPYGQPGFPFIVAVTLIYGIITMFRNRSVSNTMVLITLLVTTFFTFFILSFDTRYMMITLPFYYIAAGTGTEQLLDRLLKISRGPLASFLFMAMLVSAAGYTIYINYDFFFNTYASHQGYLGRWDGQARAGNYIKEHYDPDDTFIVLGDKLSITEDIFAFSTMPVSFKYTFWEDIMNNYKSFEEDVFKRKKKIVFVLSNGTGFLEMPGPRYSQPVDWGPIEDLYPDIVTVHKIMSGRGWPLVTILELNRPMSKGDILSLETGNNYQTDIISKPGMFISAVKFTGNIKNCELSVNNNSRRFSLDMLPSTELVLLKDRNGKLKFTPCFSDDSYRKDVYKMSNIKLSADDPRYIELASSGAGHLIYKIESPSKILSMYIETRPRLFNDINKSNSLTALYSYDDTVYNVLYTVKSSGSGEWDLHFHRDTFNSLKPDTNTVYIKFILNGEKGGQQLWSPPSAGYSGNYNSMRFIAEVEPMDWSIFPLNNGRNRIKVSQDLNNLDGTFKIYLRDNSTGLKGSLQ